MFKDAKIGDKLYSVEDGWGVVEAINTDRDHPLTIQFDGCMKSFTLNGKRYIDSKNPTLFWDKIEFEVPKRPLPDLKVDTKVIVWKSGEPKKRRHFKKFNEDGDIICFAHGATSWTMSGTFTWKYWELAE